MDDLPTTSRACVEEGLWSRHSDSLGASGGSLGPSEGGLRTSEGMLSRLACSILIDFGVTLGSILASKTCPNGALNGA